MVNNKDEIAITIDACFKADSFSPAGGLEPVSLDLMILDVTEKMPDIRNIDEACGCLMKSAEEGRVSEALEYFGRLW